MNRPLPLACGVAAIVFGLVLQGSFAAPPSGTGIVFRDRKDNMVVRNLDSWRATRVNDQTISFVGAGKPLSGAWRDQGLAVTALSLEGQATRQGDGAFQLVTATFTGGVRANVTGTGPKPIIAELTCTSVKWRAAEASSTAQLTGNVRVVQREADGQVMTLAGPSAILTLPALGQNSAFPIRRAEIAGPVTVTLLRPGTKDGKPNLVSLKATAGRLVFDDANKRLELSGGVRLEGEDAMVAGETLAERAVVTLTSERKVQEIELFGSPGTSTFREVRPR